MRDSQRTTDETFDFIVHDALNSPSTRTTGPLSRLWMHKEGVFVSTSGLPWVNFYASE